VFLLMHTLLWTQVIQGGCLPLAVPANHTPLTAVASLAELGVVSLAGLYPVSLAEPDVVTLAELHAVSLAELPAATSAELQMVN
jgi:hypothetical protein